MEKKIKYTEEDRKILSNMLEELLDNGAVSLTWQNAHLDWNLPNDNKVIIKRYHIHIGISDGETD
jgi:hypothetical protein